MQILLVQNTYNGNSYSNHQFATSLTSPLAAFQRASQDYSSDSQSGGENQIENTKYIRFLRRKKSLKMFISNVLTSQKQKEMRICHQQIIQEHKMYRVIQRWRTISSQQRRKLVQVEYLQELICYKLRRSTFKAWSLLVINNRKAELHFQKTMFGHFKLICAVQLSLRLKRIELAQKIAQRQLKDVVKMLRGNMMEQKQAQNKATDHFQSKLAGRYFGIYKKQIQSQRVDDIKLKKYKLAFLNYKRSLYRKCITALSQQTVESHVHKK